ncbi:hypothetical protein JCM3775_005982 [Rhodotorula graminis]
MACECECGHHHDWDEEEDDEALRVDLSNRPIAPLPLRKRQRLSAESSASVAELQSGIAALRLSSPAAVREPSSGSEGDDDRTARDARAASRAHERGALAAGNRGGGGGGRRNDDEDDGGGHEHGGGDERNEEAWDRWLSKRADPLEASRDPDRVAGEAPDESTKTTNSLDPGSTGSESPPTSPALSDGKKPILFGNEGQRIVQSLATANSFSPAGLFGGLGLATLHPSLAPSVAERHFDDDEDGDEDSYGVVDRTRPPVEPTMASQVSATALGLGESNKKKRKIPGLAQGGPARDGDTADDAAPVQSSPSAPFSGEFKPSNGPLAPVNPPTTAEAALAKLRIRPPHISLCDNCISARRAHRKRLRATAAKQHPLALPPVPAFVPPAMPKEGPPPLPPGSGLKGSKAIKLAMKAAKEREKEKERVRNLFAHVRVPNLFDPHGTANPPPSVVTRAIKADLDRRRGESEPSEASLVHAKPQSLDLFTFVERPPSVVELRWTAVNDQKERLKAAKERAARAREEEERRRHDKEEKMMRAEAAGTVEAPPAPLPPAPPVPAPAPAPNSTKRTPTAAPRPVNAPASAPAPAPAAPTSSLPAPSTSSAVSPPLVPPPDVALPSPPAASSLPPTPSRKPTAKKGRKKRSAHANALNVHHRDNYVPSRLPSHTPSTNGVAHDANGTPYLTSWPASDEALASAGPYASTCGAGHFCGPDEWLCLFCEYELFYGEEPLLYRAVRKRHNVLKVRQKAKDRATKATHGGASAASSATDPGPGAPVEASTSSGMAPPDEVDDLPPLEEND